MRTVPQATCSLALAALLALSSCGQGRRREMPRGQSVSDVIVERTGDEEARAQDDGSWLPFRLPFGDDNPYRDADVDVDLAHMNQVMVFGAAQDLFASPDTYEGQVVRVHGTYYSMQDQATETVYHYVGVEDETACCSVGIEFVPPEELAQDMPASDETVVTVTGVYERYEDEGGEFFHLVDCYVKVWD